MIGKALAAAFKTSRTARTVSTHNRELDAGRDFGQSRRRRRMPAQVAWARCPTALSLNDHRQHDDPRSKPATKPSAVAYEVEPKSGPHLPEGRGLRRAGISASIWSTRRRSRCGACSVEEGFIQAVDSAFDFPVAPMLGRCARFQVTFLCWNGPATCPHELIVQALLLRSSCDR